MSFKIKESVFIDWYRDDSVDDKHIVDMLVENGGISIQEIFEDCEYIPKSLCEDLPMGMSDIEESENVSNSAKLIMDVSDACIDLEDEYYKSQLDLIDVNSKFVSMVILDDKGNTKNMELNAESIISITRFMGRLLDVREDSNSNNNNNNNNNKERTG